MRHSTKKKCIYFSLLFYAPFLPFYMYADEQEQKISSAERNVKLEKSVVKAQVIMSELPIELQSKQISVVEKKDLLQKKQW